MVQGAITTYGSSITINPPKKCCNLPGDFHKDPADRIIVAATRVSRSKLITKDQKIMDYPHVTTVW